MRIIKNGSDVLNRAECNTSNCCAGAAGGFFEDVETEL